MELIIFIGIQASGKSTFFEQWFADHVHVSKDHFPNARNRGARQMKLVREALGLGRSVVVDNTNPRVQDRAALVEVAREYQVPVRAYYFVPRPQLSLERNAGRQGRARVPNVAIFATLNKLEPPTFAEGFDGIFHVDLMEPRFLVSEHQDGRVRTPPE